MFCEATFFIKCLWMFKHRPKLISSETPSQKCRKVLQNFEKIFFFTNVFFGNEKFPNTDFTKNLTLSWRRPISYRNPSIDVLCKSMDWFLYDIGLRHERVKIWAKIFIICFQYTSCWKHYLFLFNHYDNPVWYKDNNFWWQIQFSKIIGDEFATYYVSSVSSRFTYW